MVVGKLSMDHSVYLVEFHNAKIVLMFLYTKTSVGLHIFIFPNIFFFIEIFNSILNERKNSQWIY